MSYVETDHLLSKVSPDIIYVNKDTLNTLVEEYVNNYVNKHEMRNSQLLFNASNDKNFTEYGKKCSRLQKRDRATAES